MRELLQLLSNNRMQNRLPRFFTGVFIVYNEEFEFPADIYIVEAQ